MNFAVGTVNSREGEGQVIDVMFDWGRVGSFQYGISLRRELFKIVCVYVSDRICKDLPSIFACIFAYIVHVWLPIFLVLIKRGIKNKIKF